MPIVLEFSDEVPKDFPYTTSTAAAVSTRGDLIVRDLVARNNYQVVNKETSGATTASVDTYVYDATEGTTLQATTIQHQLNEDGTEGGVSIGVLYTEGSTQTMENAIEISPSSTVVNAITSDATLAATFGTSGLSFDSDSGAIYFGASQDFRIQYSSASGDTPSKLEIQALDGNTYVTRFFVAAPS